MSSSSSNTACASCKSKGRKRKCTPECLFPPENPQRWPSVNRASNVAKLQDSERLLVFQKSFSEFQTEIEGSKEEIAINGINPQAMMPPGGTVIGGNNINNAASDLLEAQLLAVDQQLQLQHQGGGAVGGNNSNAAFDFPHNMAQEQEFREAARLPKQYHQAIFWKHKQHLQQHEEMMRSISGIGIPSSVHQHHHHVPQAVIQDPQEQEFRLQKQYHQANFILPNQRRGGAVGGNNMTQAVMDRQGLVQDQELLEAHDQLAAAAFQQQLQQHEKMMRSISGIGIPGSVHQHHHHVPQAVIQDPQEQEFLEAARLQKQYHQANFNLANQEGGGTVGGNNMTQAVMDGKGLIQDQELLKAHDQLAAAAAQQQEQDFQAMLRYYKQQHEEMMRSISGFGIPGSVHGAGESSSSQPQALNDHFGGYQMQQQPPSRDDEIKRQLAMLRNYEQQQEMMRLNSGFPGTGGEASNSSAFGIPGGVHGGGEASTSQAQMQQPSQQGGEYHHHVPQNVVLKQQLAMLRNYEQQQQQQRRLDHEAGRSVGPLLFLISEFFFASNFQLISSCFSVQL